MASITRESNGRRTIQFVGADGKRRSIRLGKVSQRTAEAVKVRVEDLNTAAITGHAPSDETARWVAGLDCVLADKLAAVGLIPRQQAVTLGPFLDSYIGGRHDVKDRSRWNYGGARDNLVQYFGADRALRDVTEADAEGFQLWLKGRYAEATVSRRVKYAR